MLVLTAAGQVKSWCATNPMAGWHYRQSIQLSSPTSEAGEQVAVTFALKSAMNPDGSDLRFTADDEQTPLNYWIERWSTVGTCRVWVKVAKPGTQSLLMYYGNPTARAVSNGEKTFEFFDDFNDGIWTKFDGNPVITTTQDWEKYTTEPSVIYDDGIFKLWYGGSSALGYATSRDGIHWTKYEHNPVVFLQPDNTNHPPYDIAGRPFVLKYLDTYYLFAVRQENADTFEENIDPVSPSELRRWTSRDGIHWGDEKVVMIADQPWEKKSLSNISVLVESDGTWKMLYTQAAGGDEMFGLAVSHDGAHWTKYEHNPVMKGFYGGDPYVIKIGDVYYAWYSQAFKTGLLISSSFSKDMIHWTPLYNNPQINYTQDWEHGSKGGFPDFRIGTKHITDAHLYEGNGKVFIMYVGAQAPFGVAWFDGTLEQLAAHMQNPPLQKWAEVPYKSVENQELKMSDDESNTDPVYENAVQFDDRTGYTLEFRARSYRGSYIRPTPYREQAVVRFIDKDNFAMFRVEDKDTTYYQERVAGKWGKIVNIGANPICDDDWHTWTAEVRGKTNKLYMDGKYIGTAESTATFTGRSNLRIGLSVYFTYAAFDDVRVRKNGGDKSDGTVSGSPEKLAETP
jgi:hypothetical protein